MSCGVVRRHGLDIGSGYSSDATPSLGTSICRRCDPKKEKKKNDIWLVLYWTVLPSSFLAPPYFPDPHIGRPRDPNTPSPTVPGSFLFPQTPLPIRGNQPPSFLFLSSRTGSGPGERATRLCGSPAGCPHSRWDAAAPAPHNSVVGGGSKGFDQQKTRGWALWTSKSCFSDQALRDYAVNKQGHGDIVALSEKPKPQDPPPAHQWGSSVSLHGDTTCSVKRVGGAFMRSYTKRSIWIAKWKKVRSRIGWGWTHLWKKINKFKRPEYNELTFLLNFLLARPAAYKNFCPGIEPKLQQWQCQVLDY